MKSDDSKKEINCIVKKNGPIQIYKSNGRYQIKDSVVILIKSNVEAVKLPNKAERQQVTDFQYTYSFLWGFLMNMIYSTSEKV